MNKDELNLKGQIHKLWAKSFICVGLAICAVVAAVLGQLECCGWLLFFAFLALVG